MAQSAVQVRVADPLFQIIGHEEDSNPRRSDRRDTRSNTGVPDQFQGKRQEVTGKMLLDWLSSIEQAEPNLTSSIRPLTLPGGQNRQARCCRLEAGQTVPSQARLWGRTTGRRHFEVRGRIWLF
jgi:hypothetical protein